ncbi:class I SAM-dependent methyltransferase (plasmid) [Rhodococcoides fascians A25f]|uniref:SAM-dependent methyltransferase n=1 Tax=Rhodococcoides fascians TaxID=1828 RepID=UPI0005616131|nr:class I SAM-dependent methyltransferase [Rhodococcus fascians]QII09278.1 class I SAM-dependent methyltransferase [Rhodococcus fascians A25f]
MISADQYARDDYERELKAHWDAKTTDDINLLLGADDDLYHHHYAIGDFDRSILDSVGEDRENAILRELHRMENDQVGLILDALGPLPPNSRGMDAGSGRGGTSFRLAGATESRIDGVNFCEHHVAFAEQIARKRGWDSRVQFHLGNMLQAPFPDRTFDFVVSNETTMYADAYEAMAEFSRLLRRGGRYVMTTWCRNDAVDPRSDATRQIDEHYVCRMHRRSTYFEAFAANGLIPYHVAQYTHEAMPYWELRNNSKLRTGVEDAFLSGYSDGSLNYLVIAAERI